MLCASHLAVPVGVGVVELHIGAPPRDGLPVGVQVALQLLQADHAVVVGVDDGEQLSGGSSRHSRGAELWARAPSKLFGKARAGKWWHRGKGQGGVQTKAPATCRVLTTRALCPMRRGSGAPHAGGPQ